MPLLLLLSPPTAAAAGPAPAPAPAPVAVSLPPPSRLRASHLLFAFPRLRKYGRRDREPVATSLGELEEEDEDEEEEEEMFASDGDDDGTDRLPVPWTTTSWGCSRGRVGLVWGLGGI